MPDRNYLLKGMDDPLVQAYYQLMVDSAVLLGANKTKADEEMKAALQFEMTLANVCVFQELMLQEKYFRSTACLMILIVWTFFILVTKLKGSVTLRKN